MLISFLHKFFPKKKSIPDSLENSQDNQKTFDLKVEDIMTPRADIIGVQGNASLQDLVDIFLKTSYIALPVFRKTLDHVIGAIHIHDVLRLKDKEDLAWQKKLRPVSFVPGSMNVRDALNRLQEREEAFLLIVDEYGGVDGLLSLHHLLQAVADPLHRNEDDVFLQSFYREDGALIVDGRLSLGAVEEALSFSFEEERPIETIGGLVCALEGRVPLRGEIMTHPSKVFFEIVEADPRRIKRLAVHLPPSE